MKINYSGMYQSPPNIEMAENHRRANNIHKQSRKPHKRCACCGKNSNVTQFDMKSNAEEFSFVGMAYMFFFQFQRFQLYIYLLVFLMVGVYSIITMNVSLTCFMRKKCGFDLFNEEYKENVLVIRSLCILTMVVIVILKL